MQPCVLKKTRCTMLAYVLLNGMNISSFFFGYLVHLTARTQESVSITVMSLLDEQVLCSMFAVAYA